MTQAKRIQFSRTGGPEVLEYVALTLADPGPDEAIVRHHAIGLNFIDIYYRTGLYPAPSLPSGLGFEAAGVVEAVGVNVKHVKPGDRVAYGQSPLGAYSTARVMPAAQLVKLPKAISFEEGAAMMLKGLTAQYLLRQTYRLQGGETVLFHAAAGGVGLIACQWAKALGVKLIGTVSSEEKAALAKAHGAWQTIVTSRENIVERVLDYTEGKKCPVVYDGVGKDTWETSLDCLQPRGLMVSFGNASGPVTGVNLGILSQKGSLFVTRPTLAHHINPRHKLEATCKDLFDVVKSGQVKINISQRFALKEAGAAQQALEQRKTTGSTVLLPE